MAINVKNSQVEEQLRELCRLTGESVTEAIGKAVQQRLLSIGNRTSSMGLKEALLDLGRECSRLPDRERRSNDEILGYTDEGVFG